MPPLAEQSCSDPAQLFLVLPSAAAFAVGRKRTASSRAYPCGSPRHLVTGPGGPNRQLWPRRTPGDSREIADASTPTDG